MLPKQTQKCRSKLKGSEIAAKGKSESNEKVAAEDPEIFKDNSGVQGRRYLLWYLLIELLRSTPLATFKYTIQ